MSDREVRFGEDGLVAGIVQDAATGRVLMLGYLNTESLDLTRRTGEVHFWSRSRAELWRKGDTSGNTLHVVDIAVDCDSDALLIRAARHVTPGPCRASTPRSHVPPIPVSPRSTTCGG
jgi:phosphoribosyl-AMP cyclohydrolase